MKVCIYNSVVLIIIFSTYCYGDIVVFDTNSLGCDCLTGCSILENVDDGSFVIVEPDTVEITVDGGKYISAEVNYRFEDVAMVNLVDIISSKYSNYEYRKNDSGRFHSWRLNNEKITITVFEEPPCLEEESDRFITVIYGVWR
ncbi:hypothetical protein [Desulfuromonas acetoxidans]|uniref:hypothetical protein n=1 Tax=Desulfuromonas acetoxidans TaxID=891 RepID=UPI002930AC8C|nr:hypothetical protein [Desulfuromonas acetoxidans]